MTKGTADMFGLFAGIGGPLSRRHLLRRAVIAAGSAIALVATAAPALAKMAQKAAGYVATPKDKQECANCSLFQAPASCTLVDGAISPEGWCRFYVKKA